MMTIAHELILRVSNSHYARVKYYTFSSDYEEKLIDKFHY
jgi:hypothetical protein